MYYVLHPIIQMQFFYRLDEPMNNDLEIATMGGSADQVLCILKSLANRDRLSILCHLSQVELNVSEIEHITCIQQPTLSQQLMILRKSNVVSTRRDGKQIYYTIKDQALIVLLNTLCQLYGQQALQVRLDHAS